MQLRTGPIRDMDRWQTRIRGRISCPRLPLSPAGELCKLVAAICYRVPPKGKALCLRLGCAVARVMSPWRVVCYCLVGFVIFPFDKSTSQGKWAPQLGSKYKIMDSALLIA